VLRSLLKDLLIVVVLLAASLVLPVAGFWMCRSEIGGTVFFFAAPWTCAVWTVLASVLISSRFWLGREHVLAWRTERGGYFRSSLKATGWMFLGLLGSYACEGAYIFLLHPSSLARSLFPFSSYAPAIFAVLWCARG
jgi:hypothetical protein